MPKVFISYSWEDEDHKKWVKKLADYLLEHGIDAYLDQYDLTLGDRLPMFMEQSIHDADYVLVICTPKYKDKADKRIGGVGYEGHIITGELFSKGNEKKFIPVIRKGSVQESMPTYFLGKLAVDLSGGADYKSNLEDLLATLTSQNRKPPVKHYSFSPKMTSNDQQEPIRILGIITDKVTVPKKDGTPGSALYKIPFKLSRYPSALWKKLFIEAWNCPPSFTTMHRFNIASVSGDEVILDGTTIEEVKKYHRDTLVQCVDIANQKEKSILEQEKKAEEEKEKEVANHYANIEQIADDIKF